MTANALRKWFSQIYAFLGDTNAVKMFYFEAKNEKVIEFSGT